MSDIRYIIIVILDKNKKRELLANISNFLDLIS